jgi:hypothetical protein
MADRFWLATYSKEVGCLPDHSGREAESFIIQKKPGGIAGFSLYQYRKY